MEFKDKDIITLLFFLENNIEDKPRFLNDLNELESKILKFDDKVVIKIVFLLASNFKYNLTFLDNPNKLEPFLMEILNCLDKKKYYKFFQIKKNSGKLREICAPNQQLKEIQQLITKKLYQIFSEPHLAAHGYTMGRSIITNATQHVGKKIVINLDIKNFFLSITKNMILEALATHEGIGGSLGLTIAELCTLENSLPQGAPTSPILSNLVSRKLDNDLLNIANEYGYAYTRYADDITFSNDDDIVAEEFLKKIRQEINKYGFEVNERKVRIRKKGNRQEVTGLTVNKILNVRRSYLKNIRAILYNWEHKGADYIVEHYWKKYDKSRAAICFVHSLRGKIEYVGIVRGKYDGVYQSFLDKFYFLLDKEVFMHTHKYRPIPKTKKNIKRINKDIDDCNDDYDIPFEDREYFSRDDDDFFSI